MCVYIISTNSPCQCPIRNDTLEIFIWSIMGKILSFFHRFNSNKSLKHPQFKKKQFQNFKHHYLIQTIWQSFKWIALWIGHCHLCMEGQLKLRLQSFKNIFSEYLLGLNIIKYIYSWKHCKYLWNERNWLLNSNL